MFVYDYIAKNYDINDIKYKFTKKYTIALAHYSIMNRTVTSRTKKIKA